MTQIIYEIKQNPAVAHLGLFSFTSSWILFSPSLCVILCSQNPKNVQVACQTVIVWINRNAKVSICRNPSRCFCVM